MRGREGRAIAPSDRPCRVILVCLGAWLFGLGVCPAQLPLRYENLGIGGGESQLMAVRRGGDVDGDGLAEFAVGAPGEGYGAIHIYSGADASLMATLVGSGPMDDFGQVLSRCGDVDGDGTPDLAAGVANWGPTGPGTPPPDAGRILVFSGADFSLLFQVAGDQPTQLVGALVMGLGDLNGDDFPEIGCTFNDSSVATNNGGVRVYSFGGTRRYGEGLGGLQTLNQTWFPGQAGDPAQGAIVCNGALPGASGFFGVSLLAANTSVLGVPVRSLAPTLGAGDERRGHRPSGKRLKGPLRHARATFRLGSG